MQTFDTAAATARARQGRARRDAEVARLRREQRGDARTRTARALRGLAQRVEPSTPPRRATTGAGARPWASDPLCCAA